MRQHLPPWLKALTAEPGSREADFDWGEWGVDVWRAMRANWTPYFIVVALFMGVFSCADRQFDAELQNGASANPVKKHDPWALEKPAEANQ
jgi:hypothetical protein